MARGGDVGGEGEGEGGVHSEGLGSRKAPQSQERPEARAGQVGLEKTGGHLGQREQLVQMPGARSLWNLRDWQVF